MLRILHANNNNAAMTAVDKEIYMSEIYMPPEADQLDLAALDGLDVALFIKEFF